MTRVLSHSMLKNKKGIVYGIGIGSGNPDLITLRAYRILENVDIIIYPKIENGVSIARKIIDCYLSGKQIEIAFPIVIRGSNQSIYNSIVRQIKQYLLFGKNIAILCEGDPFFYGSYIYLYALLRKSCYEIITVPGISSVMSSASELGQPLALKNDIFTVLPGQIEEKKLFFHLSHTDSAVIIKIGRHFKKVYKVLNSLGLIEKAFYIEYATFENQKIIPISELSERICVPYFSTILIHNRGDAWR